MTDNSNQDKQPEKTVENLFDESKPQVKPKETTGSLQIAMKSREKFISYSCE